MVSEVGKTQKMPCKITNYTLDGKYCDMKIYFTKQKRILFRIFRSNTHPPPRKIRNHFYFCTQNNQQITYTYGKIHIFSGLQGFRRERQRH